LPLLFEDEEINEECLHGQLAGKEDIFNMKIPSMSIVNTFNRNDDGNITIRENSTAKGGKEYTYSFDTENEEFTRDSEKYSCMIYDGLLTLSGDQSQKELPEYVSPDSSWYSAYEKGQVKIKD